MLFIIQQIFFIYSQLLLWAMVKICLQIIPFFLQEASVDYLDQGVDYLVYQMQNPWSFLFNQSISSSIVPTEWKLVFHRIIYNQFYKYLNDKDLLANCLFGFRSLHSTLTSLLEASNNWSVNIDNGLITGVIFIDLKKAFNTIDCKILLWMLTTCGIKQRTLKWSNSYLSGVKATTIEIYQQSIEVQMGIFYITLGAMKVPITSSDWLFISYQRQWFLSKKKLHN